MTTQNTMKNFAIIAIQNFKYFNENLGITKDDCESIDQSIITSFPEFPEYSVEIKATVKKKD